MNTNSKFSSIASWEFFQGTCYFTHYAPNAKAQLAYFALSVVPFNLRVLLCNAVPDHQGYNKIAIRKRKFIRLYHMTAMNLLVPLVIADSGANSNTEISLNVFRFGLPSAGENKSKLAPLYFISAACFKNGPFRRRHPFFFLACVSACRCIIFLSEA